MKVTGRIRIPDVSGNIVELLKWTCGKCGYTMLFDLTIARNVPYNDDQFSEVLPDN
jgi:predicted nucleic-acid-binding Zn-ribbon protein